jgi:DNA polymerase-4
MVRKILHLDLDAFFCAVEAKRDPLLRDKAFAVGGRPDQRGVVASCSYAARQFGIHSAMPMARAVKQCPDLIIIPSRYHAYQDASRQVMAQLHNLTPLVEQISIDEAFLDVSELPDSAETLARNLQATINNELGLPCSLGVATNKLVAKIANNIGKASVKSAQPPNTIKVVSPGQEAAFLAPLPVRELWGVGPKTEEQLATMGIFTIGDLAAQPETDLARKFGKLGNDLSQRAKGLDDRPVETEHEAKSVSHETTFARDITDGEKLRQVLRHLSEQVGRQLRKKKLSGTTIKIKLRWADFTTLTRQTTLDHSTNLDDDIYTAAEALFTHTWPSGKRVRLIGVGVSGFEPQAYQPGLWDKDDTEQAQRWQSTLDTLRDRFGDQAIQRGSQLKKTDSTD